MTKHYNKTELKARRRELRKNQTLVFQMQVVPGSKNEIVWKFVRNGLYDIKSTEYSGPKGAGMGIKDSVIVTGCQEEDKYSPLGGKL